MAKKVIWKYPIHERNQCLRIAMPKGAQPLTIQVQATQAVLWALVDPDQPLADIRVFIVGTGIEIQDAYLWPYLCTFQEEYFVWHVFISSDGEEEVNE